MHIPTTPLYPPPGSTVNTLPINIPVNKRVKVLRWWLDNVKMGDYESMWVIVDRIPHIYTINNNDIRTYLHRWNDDLANQSIDASNNTCMCKCVLTLVKEKDTYRLHISKTLLIKETYPQCVHTIKMPALYIHPLNINSVLKVLTFIPVRDVYDRCIWE